MYAQFNLMYQSHAVWGTYVIVHVYIYICKQDMYIKSCTYTAQLN